MACGTSEPLPKPDGAEAKKAERRNGSKAESSRDDKGQIAEQKNNGTDILITAEADGIAATTAGVDQQNANGAADDARHQPMDLEQANEAVVSGEGAKAEATEGKSEPKMENDQLASNHKANHIETSDAMDVDELENMESDDEEELPLLFRCIWCKRCAHYEHCK